MKYNDNGEYKDIYIKTFDTLPVGAEVDFTGNEVPAGWTQVDSYSTSEINTGQTWIDGKTIYRIVLTGTTGTSNQTKTIGTIANLGEIVNIGGYVKTSTQSVPVNFVYSSEQNSCYRENNNIILRVTASAYTSKDCYVIVEYTKSS